MPKTKVKAIRFRSGCYICKKRKTQLRLALGAKHMRISGIDTVRKAYKEVGALRKKIGKYRQMIDGDCGPIDVF